MLPAFFDLQWLICYVATINIKYDLRELLVSYLAPPQMVDNRIHTRYGRYWNNKISEANQN